ncbi:MAG: T9SS type A sorting domain-containing protein [Ferruginibacter sp.]|nr:T9SS type A sorting domain-containing protein [Ferruginibacter sp.]
MNCSPIISPIEDCHNYHFNPDFSATSPYNWDFPFNYNFVTQWVASSGTPQLDDPNGIISTSTVGDHFAYMGFVSDFDGNGIEGIAQKIPTLIQGDKYLYTFNKAFSFLPFVNHNVKLKIELLYCSDFLNFPPAMSSAIEPVFQTNVPHQTIYCEINPSNPNWEKVLINFTANSNYDMVMITPSFTDTYWNTGFAVGGGIGFAYPQLVHINSFSAGVPPTPTAGNCNVTIGPPITNCIIANGSFTWHGPNGQTITTTTINQQIQLDASLSANVGTWTLEMTLPNTVITNNTCSDNGGMQASVVVPTCLTGIWPKVYNTIDGGADLYKDYHGNVILRTSGITSDGLIFNHIGNTTFPPLPYYASCMQFNSNGVSIWNKHELLDFALRSGTLHFDQNIYFNGMTGGNVAIPYNLLPNESIIAETISGSIITKTDNFNGGQFLRVYDQIGNLISSTIYDLPFFLSKFNLNTNNLFLLSSSDYNGVQHLKRFHFNGNSLIQTLSIPFPPNSILNDFYIDNLDNCFIRGANTKLMHFDFVNGTLNPVNIPGFDNNNLGDNRTLNRYTDDIYLFSAGNYLYILNFANMTQKKIYVSSPLGGVNYLFDDGYVYITNSYLPNLQIGNQFIPLLSNTTTLAVFITKLDINIDFSFRAPATNSENTFSQKSNTVQENATTLQTSKQADAGINKTVLDINSVKTTNISSIQLYNQVGQLITVITTQQAITDLMSNKAPTTNFVAGLYFLRVTYKNNKTETIKRFLN